MNKNLYLKVLGLICLMFSVPGITGGHLDHEKGHSTGNEAIASDWVTAGYTGKDASIKMVEQNMADDGVSVQGRYVGFGFNWDPRENEMRVGRVTPDSPADGVLMVGDLFLEVEGIKVSPENFGKLPFRGLPGKTISAVIDRSGKQIEISIARGTVRGEITKSQVLENMNSGDAESWPAKKFRIIEVLSKDNIVYVLSHATQTDDMVDLDFMAYTVTRFMFNENGKVVEVANLTEDRFVLEQT
ncbi:MAG: hypothetical protein VX658_03700, partial [Pseudomonadota bacterium]|nr:hypothetical protein [Pseudomonadota bacterium]